MNPLSQPQHQQQRQQEKAVSEPQSLLAAFALPSVHPPASVVVRLTFDDQQVEVGGLPRLEVTAGADKCSSYREMLAGHM